MTTQDPASNGYEGALRARWDSIGLSGSVKAGGGISGQSAQFEARAFGARFLLGAGRSRRWSGLEVSSSSGSIDLSWNDVTDSGIIALALPVGPVLCSTSLWKTARHAISDTGIADTGYSLGWSVAASTKTALGSWTFSMDREDRILSTTGRFQRQIFHSQELSSARAEARLDWTSDNWEVQVGTRQYRLESPQGDLDHPTVAWNILSKQQFAAVYAVAASQQDYFSGRLAIQRWDVGFRHSWNNSAWTAHAGLAGFLWTCQADLLRRRLTVVGFLPSVSADSLVSGSGWLAAAGPEASISWHTARFGRVELSASWEAPLAGDWNDRLAKPAPEAVGSGHSSLPIDPWSLWSVQLSWSQ